MTTQNIKLVCGTVLLVAVVASVVVLAWHGSISGTQAITTIGGISAVAVGGLLGLSGVNSGASAASSAIASQQVVSARQKLPE